MEKMSDVLFRAFAIKSQKISSSANIFDAFKQAIEHTAVKDRSLKLSVNDDDSEQDILCNYDFLEGNIFYGMIMRIDPKQRDTQIDNKLYDQMRFTYSDIIKNGRQNNTGVYKNHYHFCIKDKTVITTQKKPGTIKNLQTYSNWLLKTDSSPYIFNPLIKARPPINLSQIDSIVIEDPTQGVLKKTQNLNNPIQKAFNIINKKALLKNLFIDTPSLDDALLDELISAQLLLKFNKKIQKSKDEEIKNALAALLKPMADLDHTTLVGKSFGRISGEDMLEEKKVTIERTDKNNVSDEHVKQEMIIYLNELNQ